MSNKINCHFHDDSTASLHIYDDHYHCFGCGARGTLDKLDTSVVRAAMPFSIRGPEDMPAALKRIDALPLKQIRGLELPYDHRGYYIRYPNTPYYVRRSWTNVEPRFYSPFGIRKPPLVLRYGSYATQERGPLLVIEGQINALSAQLALGTEGPAQTILCPGASTDFNKPDVVSQCLNYADIFIIVDNDAAGVVAAVQLRNTLLNANKRVTVVALDQDFNDILVNDGKESLKQKIKQALHNEEPGNS